MKDSAYRVDFQLGATIKRERLARGWSVKELTRQVNELVDPGINKISEGQINQIENATTRTTRQDVLNALMQIFNLNLNERVLIRPKERIIELLRKDSLSLGYEDESPVQALERIIDERDTALRRLADKTKTITDVRETLDKLNAPKLTMTGSSSLSLAGRINELVRDIESLNSRRNSRLKLS